MAALPFVIKPAVRTAQPGLFCFWGGSSSGKTYSALRFARGLVGPFGKIGMIDTENRRGLLYAGEVGGAFDHIDFQPPFTPERFIEAFKTFEVAGGYGCVIIDSSSHVWGGEGGVIEMAESARTKDGRPLAGLNKWAKPKASLQRMVNTLIRARCHVIFCMRAKMGNTQMGKGQDAQVITTGLEPIMEKGLVYEMLCSIAFGPDHKPLFNSAPKDPGDRFWVNPLIPAVKAPGQLIGFIRPGEFITEETGEQFKLWLDGAERDLPGEARLVAGRGSAVFRGWWPSLTQIERGIIRDIIPELQEISARADADALEGDALEGDEVTAPVVEVAQPAAPLLVDSPPAAASAPVAVAVKAVAPPAPPAGVAVPHKPPAPTAKPPAPRTAAAPPIPVRIPPARAPQPTTNDNPFDRA